MSDYVKHLRWAKLKVGIVVTLSLLIVLFAIMFAGSIEMVFAPKVRIKAVFNDVKGLREGSPVWFSGVEIGAVESIQFTTEDMVLVKMLIVADTLEYLRKDSNADILTLGLLGDKYIEITPGSKKADPLAAEDTIEGMSHIEIRDVVETGKNSIESFSGFIRTLEDILVRVEKGEGSAAKFLKDPAIYDNLRDATDELTAILRKARKSTGTVNKLLEEEQLYENLASSAKKIDSFAGKIEKSDGSLNRFIEDESLYRNLNAVSEKLNRFLERIDRGEGVVGKLMNDDALTDELRVTLNEMNALIRDIKENPKKYFKFSIF